MTSAYVPTFGDCLDPGDPVAVHAYGKGCRQNDPPNTDAWGIQRNAD
jgi:hypothetical protein